MDDWIAVSLKVGTGNKTLQVKSTVYTGRVNRVGSFKLSYRFGDTPSIIVPVTQLGDSILEIIGSEVFTFPNSSGGAALYNFNTNIKYFCLKEDNGKRVASGRIRTKLNGVSFNPIPIKDAGVYEIPNDPGANSWFNFEMQLRVFENTSVIARHEVYHLETYNDKLQLDRMAELFIEIPGITKYTINCLR